MPSQPSVEFKRYDTSMPAAVEVYCAKGFKESVADRFHGHKPQSITWIANFNALVKLFATGVVLSADSFAPEPPGYAFRCGPLRFYGVFSSKSTRYFALSHVIYKKTNKLAQADKQRMSDRLKEFNAYLSYVGKD